MFKISDEQQRKVRFPYVDVLPERDDVPKCKTLASAMVPARAAVEDNQHMFSAQLTSV